MGLRGMLNEAEKQERLSVQSDVQRLTASLQEEQSIVQSLESTVQSQTEELQALRSTVQKLTASQQKSNATVQRQTAELEKSSSTIQKLSTALLQRSNMLWRLTNVIKTHDPALYRRLPKEVRELKFQPVSQTDPEAMVALAVETAQTEQEAQDTAPVKQPQASVPKAAQQHRGPVQAAPDIRTDNKHAKEQHPQAVQGPAKSKVHREPDRNVIIIDGMEICLEDQSGW